LAQARQTLHCWWDVRSSWPVCLWFWVVFGACSEAPLAPSVACKSASDCPVDHVCAQGECQTIFCRTDAECPSYFICNGGTCRDNRTDETRVCRSDGECLEGEDCRQGHCYDDDLCGTANRPCVPGGVDSDGDGLVDDEDNCPEEPNNEQSDLDGDGQGDGCDPDDDNDGVVDGEDNCPEQPNPDQGDQDSDGRGDSCQTIPAPDADSDGIADEVDNCHLASNPDQLDSDQDGRGDACDAQPQTFNYKLVGGLVQTKHNAQGEQHRLRGRVRLSQQQRSQGTNFMVRPLNQP
jgi:hypothetical protein